MILPVVKVPAKVLTTPVKKVLKFDAKLHKLIKDMSDTLLAARDPEGVGLAAPQVGVNLAIFITRPDKRSKIREYINPEIVTLEDLPPEKQKKESDKTTFEGCLSIDRIWAPIERPQRVFLRYQTLDRTQHEEWFEGFKAVIIQHEVDHLNGVLFTTRAVQQDAPVYEERGGELNEINMP